MDEMKESIYNEFSRNRTEQNRAAQVQREEIATQIAAINKSLEGLTDTNREQLLRIYREMTIGINNMREKNIEMIEKQNIRIEDSLSKIRESNEKKLDEMRALGLTPIPKLNFSTCHHTWLKEYRRMTSTRYYYEACADVIREVCEVFDNPRLFHLGLDEEDTIGNQRFRECVHIRAKDLWWHDVYFYLGEVEKHGTRPWVWADNCWENPDIYVKRMPKSVLQSNWYYNVFRDVPTDHWHYKAIAAYELLEKHGFELCGVIHLRNGDPRVAYEKLL
jgi:hypothetical protein